MARKTEKCGKFRNVHLGNGGWNNIDIAAISADGSEIIDLTRSGYSDNNSKWTHDGKGVTYQTDKYGYRSHGSWGSQEDICIMFLDGEAFDRYTLTKEESELAKESKAGKTDSTIGKKDKKSKKKDKNKDTDSKTEKLAFDFANRDERSLRITRHSASMGDYFLTPDMDKLYYVAKFEKRRRPMDDRPKERRRKDHRKRLGIWQITARFSWYKTVLFIQRAHENPGYIQQLDKIYRLQSRLRFFAIG